VQTIQTVAAGVKDVRVTVEVLHAGQANYAAHGWITAPCHSTSCIADTAASTPMPARPSRRWMVGAENVAELQWALPYIVFARRVSRLQLPAAAWYQAAGRALPAAFLVSGVQAYIGLLAGRRHQHGDLRSPLLQSAVRLRATSASRVRKARGVSGVRGRSDLTAVGALLRRLGNGQAPTLDGELRRGKP
jgi:hypothetical protein